MSEGHQASPENSQAGATRPRAASGPAGHLNPPSGGSREIGPEVADAQPAPETAVQAGEDEAAAPALPPPPPPRGHLKIYLGYSSHTGKTWRLLEEARRRQSRGEDVVVGWVRPQDRPALAPLLEGLEVLPLRRDSLDLEAVLRRGPGVCFVDELAHDNPPGSVHPQRYQDVEDLLGAGIDVVTAMNIQYVADLREQILKVLGKAPAVSVPEEFLRKADEVVLVDASAGVVRGRSQQAGLLPAPEKTLLALRGMALLYSAENVEELVRDYRHEHHIEETWETQERVLVCLTANSRGPHLIDRACKVAERWNGELWALYVTPDARWSNLSEAEAETVRGFLGLARAKGARVQVVEGAEPACSILAFAHEHGVTQICLGHAAAYPYRGALSGTVAGRIMHGAAGIDVHLIADEGAAQRQSTSVSSDAPSLPFLARLLSATPRPESRGHLRVYLSYAPGSGKSWRMLQDGGFLKGQGQDVVVGYCDSHDRPDLVEVLRNFETVPPVQTPEGLPNGLNVAAVVARRPQVCLVDDLAAATADGRVRWEEVEALRDRDIHVFATVDVSGVEGLKDAVERITGLEVSSTVPDWLLDEAEELIFVDVATRALLNRVRRGAVFSGGEIPDDLRGLFNEGSLEALRELAMRLAADRVQDRLAALEGSRAASADKEVVLVAVDARPGSARAVRRARRLADRMGASCFAVHVAPDEDWTGVSLEDRARTQEHLGLARTLHLETRILHGSHVARTLADFATRHRVTRLLLGRSRKTGWREFFQRSLLEQIIRLCPWLDLVVISERS
jgi:two-component system sensor histidine kinase KdpD